MTQPGRMLIRRGSWSFTLRNTVVLAEIAWTREEAYAPPRGPNDLRRSREAGLG